MGNLFGLRRRGLNGNGKTGWRGSAIRYRRGVMNIESGVFLAGSSMTQKERAF